MEVYSVYRNKKWIEYKPSITLRTDPRVTKPYMQIAASAYGSAIQKGYSEVKANILAEAVVFKHLYTDLQYSNDFEEEIQSLYT